MRQFFIHKVEKAKLESEKQRLKPEKIVAHEDTSPFFLFDEALDKMGSYSAMFESIHLANAWDRKQQLI